MQGQAAHLHAGGLHDAQRGSLLRAYRGRLRWVARLRLCLSRGMDLCEFRVCGRAPGLPSNHVRHARRGTVLWAGRGRVRGYVGLSDDLSATWMGV